MKPKKNYHEWNSTEKLGARAYRGGTGRVSFGGKPVAQPRGETRKAAKREPKRR